MIRKKPIRPWLLLPLAALAGCHGRGDSPADPPVVSQAKALVRKQEGAKIGFTGVQFVGDTDTGQTCGYFTRPNSLGGTDAVRFIVFAGGQGPNPYIDDPASPYPRKKSDFNPAWQKGCVKQGYQDPHSSDGDNAAQPAKKK